MLRGREVGPLCTPHRRHVVGTVHTPTKRLLIHSYVAARTVCKSNSHGATNKFEVILSLFQLNDAQIQTSRNSCNCYEVKILSPQQSFHQNGMSQEDNCRFTSMCVFRPLKSTLFCKSKVVYLVVLP